jgi:hypothetical protein
MNGEMPREGVIVGLILIRRASPGRWGPGAATLTLGLVGLAASAGWLILGAYIDAVTR